LFKVINVILLLLSISAQAYAAPADNYRLELTKAKLSTKKSEEAKAWQQYRKLIKQHPNNYQVLVDYTLFLYQIEQPTLAYQTLKKLENLYPENESIKLLKEDLFRNNRSFASLDYNYEAQEDSTHQHKLEAIGELKLDQFDLGANYKYNNFDSDLLRNPKTGNLEKASVEETIRELYLRYNHKDGHQNKFSTYFSDSDSGISNESSIWNIKGYNKLTLEYQKPNWDYLEGIVGNATRDSIAFTNKYRITPRFTSLITLGLNRYGVDEDTNVAKSRTLTANLSYSFSQYSAIVKMLGNNSYSSISYNIDGEYKSDLEERLSSSNEIYNPLPVSTREIHTLTLSVGKDVSEDLAIDAYVGYSKNRFDDAAPSYGTKLTYRLTKDADLIIGASQALSTDGTNDKVQNINVGIKQRF